MMFDQPGSRRWTHFRSALQLAIQRSARKWTFEDFAECFPLYVEEEPSGASATFNSISDYIEAQNFRDLEKLFNDYDVRQNIDLLHKVIGEAKDRKERGDAGNDVWREDLEPRTTVCARTVPILESEVQRLRTELGKVKADNHQLQSQLEQNVKAKDNAVGRALGILNDLDKTHEEWSKLSADDLESWTAQTIETYETLKHP